MTIIVRTDFRSEPNDENPPIVKGIGIDITSPDDSLYDIEQTAEKIVKQLEERYGQKWTWHLPVHKNAVKKEKKNELVT